MDESKKNVVEDDEELLCDEISPEKFQSMFSGKNVRLGLVRNAGAIMEQWATLGNLNEIITWDQKWGTSEGNLESVLKGLKEILGEGGPLICVFDEDGDTSVLVNPADGKIFPNWE